MSKIWRYVTENFWLSFAAWGTTHRGGTLLGIIAAALLGLAGLGLEWQPAGAKLYVYLAALWFLALVSLVTPIRMWFVAQGRIDELTAAPQRVGLVQVAKLAMLEGWDFKGKPLLTNDFLKAIRQAAADDEIVLFGRRLPPSAREADKAHFLLMRIAKEFWVDKYIDVPMSDFPEVKNFDVHTRTSNFSTVDAYGDLYVADQTVALNWLKREGDNWRGTTEAAEVANNDRLRDQMKTPNAWAAHMRKRWR